MPTEAEMLAARDAAVGCAHAVEWLMQVATGLTSTEGSPEPGSVDKDLTELPGAIEGLCAALTTSSGKLSEDLETLWMLDNFEPPQEAGMFCATAHRLAWRLAHNRWLRIRNVDPRFCFSELARDGFDLDPGLVLDNLSGIREALRARRPIDGQRLATMIRQESERAVVRLHRTS